MSGSLKPTPGLTCPLAQSDLVKAHRTYNESGYLRERSAAVAQYVLDRLGPIFTKNGAQDTFGVTLMYQHCKLDPDHVMCAEPRESAEGGCWTRKMAMGDIDLAQTCGKCFKVDENGELVAYKLSTGQVSLSTVDHSAFVQEFAEFVAQIGAADLFGLQLLDEQPRPSIGVDFEDIGTVLIPECATSSTFMSGLNMLATGWMFEVDAMGDSECHQLSRVPSATFSHKDLASVEGLMQEDVYGLVHRLLDK
ncbi:hypothetical protein CBER1_10552 [Cercospora berteroae]|uniref:Uncharacterized protein n=1 Tax=Cercospora berteroae TaxID=357750 RepID=A0A2S6CJ01_9PEZI|nr:hypothetical protein CBER1_10552 [Cercospora berteroae]